METRGITLEQIMGRHLAGDPAALADLLRETRRPLFAFLFRMTASPDVAEDLLQETWIAIHAGAKTWDPARAFMPWAYAIARNAYYAWRRAEVKVIPLRRETGPEPAGAEFARRVELRMDIGRMLKQLSDPVREAFVMKHFQGLKFHEIAEIQAAPLPTVKARVQFAVGKLRSALMGA